MTRMVDSGTQTVGEGTRSSGPSMRHALRTEGWKAVLVALLAIPLVFVGIRSWRWDVLMQELLYDHIQPAETAVVAATPLTVIALQVGIAVTVGLLFGVQTFAYLSRAALLPDGWWTGGRLRRPTRWLLVALGVGLFPVGAMLGQSYVAPLVVDVVVAGGTTVSITVFATAASIVVLGAGVVAQLVFVGGVLALARLRSADASSQDLG